MASTAIKNAFIFDGKNIREAGTVVIENGIITNQTSGDTEIDGKGCTLLPGLIDCHVHLNDIDEHLAMAGRHGVTTVLDMGARNPEDIDRMKNIPGMPTVLAAYNISCAPGSKATKAMGFSARAIVRDTADAVRFVDEQISHGADYIKMILEEPGLNGGVAFSTEVGKAVTAAAHTRKKRVVAHAISVPTYEKGLELGVDVLTHISYTKPLTQEIINTMVADGTVCVPTLVMLKNSIERITQLNPNFRMRLGSAWESVAALHKAGVPIFAGTDSNMDDPTTLSTVPFGKSMYEELELLTKSGLTPTEALMAATAGPADYFGLTDRGEITPGKRADLILVEGNPTVDIHDIGKVKTVWIAGSPVCI